MPRYQMVIEYDGADFCGWQVQPNGETVQSALEDALRVIVREEVTVVGSGRTDTGVHALGQVAHFDVNQEIDCASVEHSLNGYLPGSISIRSLERAAVAFHARFDARRRTYVYLCCTEPRALERHFRYLLRPVPDFDLMNESAALIAGRHDFSSFCRTQSETENRVCEVYEAAWRAEERAGNWRFVITADRFLHGMVRAVIGTLLEIGRGTRPAAEINHILASRDRRMAGPAAPAHALILHHVEY